MTATVNTATSVVDYNNDGTPDQIVSSSKTLDSRGNLLGITTGFDYDADGTVDSNLIVTQTFDSADRLLTRVETQDIISNTLTQTYDNHGNLLSAVRA